MYALTILRLGRSVRDTFGSAFTCSVKITHSDGIWLRVQSPRRSRQREMASASRIRPTNFDPGALPLHGEDTTSLRIEVGAVRRIGFGDRPASRTTWSSAEDYAGRIPHTVGRITVSVLRRQRCSSLGFQQLTPTCPVNSPGPVLKSQPGAV